MKHSFIIPLYIISLLLLALPTKAQFWDTFESYTTQADADANWVSSDNTDVRVNITNDEIDCTWKEPDHDVITFDLGYSASNTWVLRFEWKLTSHTTTTGFWFGLSDKNHTANQNTTQDFIGGEWIAHSATDKFRLAKADNSIFAYYTQATGMTWSNGTTYYCEVKRTSATGYKIEFFSDVNFTTSIAQVSGTCSSTITGLRYIKFTGQGSSPGPIVSGTIDNVQFCNGTTTYNCNPTPLPIELLSFSAQWKDNTYTNGLLQWSTAQEINNDYFIVEQSADGVSFTEMGRVNGVGTSNTTHHYQLIDNNPYPNQPTYYRLKQVDFDGEYSYSDIEVLKPNTSLEFINLYPNPVVNDLVYEVYAAKNMEVFTSIVNSIGQRVYSNTNELEEGVSTQTLNLSDLSAGEYIIHIKSTSGLHKIARRFVVNEN